MSPLRDRCERIAREMSALVVELRDRRMHVHADAVTRCHDRFVRVAELMLRVVEGSGSVEPTTPSALRVILGGRR